MNYEVNMITILGEVHKDFNPKIRFRTSGKRAKFAPDTDIAVGMCREKTVVINRDLS